MHPAPADLGLPEPRWPQPVAPALDLSRAFVWLIFVGRCPSPPGRVLSLNLSQAINIPSPFGELDGGAEGVEGKGAEEGGGKIRVALRYQRASAPCLPQRTLQVCIKKNPIFEAGRQGRPIF